MINLNAGPLTLILALQLASAPGEMNSGMDEIAVSADHNGFIRRATGNPFVPFGFNYDHDDVGRLLEDYWEKEWDRVEADFAEMRQLGANVVRIHLQTCKFLDAPDKANQKALAQLDRLVQLAEKTGLYLNLTGLGCYHKRDVPAWYDGLAESERWAAQAFFWQSIAKRCAGSPAIFCYDLMNEPVVPGGRRKEGDWLGPPFGDKHFVQLISLDQGNRPRPDIAKAWIDLLCGAIRQVDRRHLITVGMVDWSLDRKGLTSGFVPGKVVDSLDFVSVHLYPQTGKLDVALETLRGFSVGKPVVVEETFPLQCTAKELETFMDKAGTVSCGWISFYWGKPPNELRRSKTIGDAMLLEWLGVFEKRARRINSQAP